MTLFMGVLGMIVLSYSITNRMEVIVMLGRSFIVFVSIVGYICSLVCYVTGDYERAGMCLGLAVYLMLWLIWLVLIDLVVLDDKSNDKEVKS